MMLDTFVVALFELKLLSSFYIVPLSVMVGGFVVITARCICELLTEVIHSFTYVDVTAF